MVDYTHLILDTETPEVRHSILFVLTSPGSHKLQLVKAIKIATNWGLLDSKNFADESSKRPVMFRKSMTFDEIEAFKKNLNGTDAEFTLEDRQQIRNKKLLDIGIGDKSDLIEELSIIGTNKIITGGYSIENIKKILSSIYSRFDEEELNEIYLYESKS